MNTYTKNQVSRAGKQLREGHNKSEDFTLIMDVLSFWRYEHEKPLDEAFDMLQEITLSIDRRAIFGKRLKRYASVEKKLKRFSQMNLKNMQDIGGSRAIVTGQNKLNKVVRALKKKPQFRNVNGSVKVKDYIQRPKEDGYRSFHIIGKFRGRGDDERFIEVQVRTVIQHDWATALEIVDLFTGQALKSNLGKDTWKDFFCFVGEQFALMDSISNFSFMTPREQFTAYQQKVVSNEAHLTSCIEAQRAAKAADAIRVMNGFAQSLKLLDDRLEESKSTGYVLVELNVKERLLETKLFDAENSQEAERMYTEREKEHFNNDNIVVALISSDHVNNIKEAYPNYFGDSKDFLKYLMYINSLDLDRARPGFLLSLLNRAGFGKFTR